MSCDQELFFLGIIELCCLRHVSSAAAHARGEQQFITVTCDILLTVPSFAQC